MSVTGKLVPRALVAGGAETVFSTRSGLVTVTAVALPGDLPPLTVRERMKARGIETAEGLGPYGATAFRIGHMGDIRVDDVERTLAALAEALVEVRAG